MTSRTRLAGFLLIASSLGPWLSAANALANTPSADAQPADGAAPAKFVAPGLGDPGQLVEVSIESGRAVDGAFTLDGQDARQQLVVTGKYSTGQLRDLTTTISFTSEPAGVVNVESTGHVIPLADGTATITAKSPAGPAGTIRVSVIHYGNDPAVNFPNQIVPIFTKLGCNSGGCHGKASGQNGFKLSLLGFEPTEDYEHLVKEGRGRRLFPAAPDKSLLLLKPIGEMPHGGGTRMEVDTHSYRLMRRWILQGMPYGSDTDPTVARIEVFPKERTMPQAGQQQLLVIAHYTNGATEDVTGTVKFEPNNPEMAEVSVTGLVKTLDLTGDVAVMARYQGQVGVFRASVPLGVPVETTPQPKNFVDDLVFKKLKTLGVPPSGLCDDATFVRRAAVDIAGRLPTPEETEKFLADTNPNKRDAWVDSLLASTDYADFFANKWNSILRNKRRNETYARGTRIFHDWVRDSLHANLPYDQFARQLLTATGEIGQKSAGGLVSGSERPERAGGRLRPIVPGAADSMCPLPSSSVREVEPAGLLRVLGLLLAVAAEAGRAVWRGPRSAQSRRGLGHEPQVGPGSAADRPGRQARFADRGRRSATGFGRLDGRQGQPRSSHRPW